MTSIVEHVDLSNRALGSLDQLAEALTLASSLNVSNNKLLSLEALGNSAIHLVRLHAVNNALSSVLDFQPRHATAETGETAATAAGAARATDSGSGMLDTPALHAGARLATTPRSAHDAGAAAGHLHDSEHATKLTAADLSGNELKRLRELQAHAHLRALRLAENGLTELWGLGSLRRIRHLDLQGNQLSDLRGLAGLTSLRTLIVARNRLTSFAGLPHLPRLTCIDAAENKVSSMAGLSHAAPALQSLNLRENDIQSVYELDALASLVHLGSLDISANALDDGTAVLRLRVLWRLPHLARLDGTPCTPTEKVAAQSLHGQEVQFRQRAFNQILPDQMFTDVAATRYIDPALEQATGQHLREDRLCEAITAMTIEDAQQDISYEHGSAAGAGPARASSASPTERRKSRGDGELWA